jgi:hypothetical protein
LMLSDEDSLARRPRTPDPCVVRPLTTCAISMRKLDPNLLFFGNLVDASTRLEELEQFSGYVEGFLQQEQRYFREQAHPDLEREFLPMFAYSFPPILHSSLVISTAIFLELEMRGYCEALRDNIGLELRAAELSGNALDRFRTYVSKVAKLSFDPVRARWEDMVGLFEIRNCLVHAGGNLKPFQRASVIRAFSARHGTPLCEDDQMIIDLDTSTIVLKIATDFINDIYELALVRFPGHYGPRQSE